MRTIYGLSLTGLAMADPCQKLCEFEGPILCPNGSSLNGGVCENYFYAGGPLERRYCYSAPEWESHCPRRWNPVTPELAEMYLSAPRSVAEMRDAISNFVQGKASLVTSIMAYRSTVSFLSHPTTLPADPVAYWNELGLSSFMAATDEDIVIDFIKIISAFPVESGKEAEFASQVHLDSFCRDKADLLMRLIMNNFKSHWNYREKTSYRSDIYGIDRTRRGALLSSGLEKLCPVLYENSIAMRAIAAAQGLYKHALAVNPINTRALSLTGLANEDLWNPSIAQMSHSNLNFGIREVTFASHDELRDDPRFEGRTNVDFDMIKWFSGMVGQFERFGLLNDYGLLQGDEEEENLTRLVGFGKLVGLAFLEQFKLRINISHILFDALWNAEHLSPQMASFKEGFNSVVPIDVVKPILTPHDMSDILSPCTRAFRF